jgi:hypothetical protein
VQAQEGLATGSSRFAFELVPPDNGELLVAARPTLWVVKDEQSPPLGPFSAQWLTWGPKGDDADATPPAAGFYVAELRVPAAGNWQIVAQAEAGGKPVAGVAAMPVRDDPVAAVGTRALSEPTPVATTPEDAAKIDTRRPPSPLHYVSLNQALANGLPTVVVFATPQLCTSRMCGPVVDEVLHVYDSVGRSKANFIHVEIYPDRDANKPTPAFLRWGFESEPWTLVIDRAGIIRGRFEGPVVAPEVTAALQPLLAA